MERHHARGDPRSFFKELDAFALGDTGQLTTSQNEEVTTIQSVTAQLADLVAMILDVSRIQLGRVPLSNVPLDLRQMFKEILQVIEIKAQEKKVQLNVSLPPTLPTAILDKRYTHMTVENLLSNAVKYTPSGGRVDLNVEVKNDVLYCSVADTGCGIPKAEQGEIFGRLFRASNVQNAVEGNGFGLYVAKGAVEAQGGSIHFTSEEGKGTTFFVELPLKYPAADAATGAPATPHVAAPTAAGALA